MREQLDRPTHHTGRFEEEILRHVDAWTERGLLTEREAEAIRSYERVELPPVRRISWVTEAIGYLGAALAFAAGFALMAERYAGWPKGARVAIPALVAAGLLGAGLAIRRSDEPAIRRLVSVLWFLSVGGVAWLIAELAFDVAEPADDALFLVGAGTAAYALVLYTFMRRDLLQIALFASSVGTLVGLSLWVGATWDNLRVSALAGAAIWALAIVWILGGWRGVLRPERTALAMGAVAVLYSPTLIAAWNADVAIWMGLATAAALMAAGVSLHSVALLALAGVGLFGYLLAAILYYLADAIGAPLALFLAGVTLIGVAVLLMRLGRATRRGEQPT